MKLLPFVILFATISARAQGPRPGPPKYTVPPIHLSSRVSGKVKVSHWSRRFIFPVHDKDWHFVKIRMPKGSDPRLAVVWIQDETHPIGSDDWTEYDPREMGFTERDFIFKAVPGDRISYTVGWRQTN